MSSCLDYKWRKRMCHKWQEEEELHQQQREQQLALSHPLVRLLPHITSLPPPAAAAVGSTVSCKSLRTFVEDPMNLHKLFLSRRTLQLLKQRSDFQRLVKGCFVRVKFGPGHCVAQIQGSAKWRPSSSTSELTLILRIDHTPRVFPLQQLANSYYEPRELLEWEYVWQSCNFLLPSKRLVEQKYKLITDAKLQLQVQEKPLATCIIHKLATSTAQGIQLCQVHAMAAPSGGRYRLEPMDCYQSHLPQQQQQQHPPSDATGELAA